MNAQRLPFVLSLALLLTLGNSPGAPVAVPDSFSLTEDRTLIVDDQNGVLANDTEDGPPTAVLQDNVSNGILVFNPNGSFTYSPAAGFSGTDTFTYNVLGSSGAQVFTVDQANSNVSVSASVEVSGIGSDSDSDNSAVAGTITADPTPDGTPFNALHITDLDLALTDSLSLNFSFVFGLAGIDVNTTPNSITVAMVSPGFPSNVDGAGNFNQPNNVVSVNGVLNVNATGLADGQVPEGPQDISISGQTLDIDGTITQSGNELVLISNVSFSGAFDVGGNPVTLDLNGTIRATSPAAPASSSNTTTVTLNVQPINNAPLVRDERYFMRLGTQLTRGTQPGGIDVLVPEGALWSYLVSGTAPDATWIDLAFDDAAWPTGNAQLGFDEDDEATLIGFGGDPNNVFITTWFRHKFPLANAGEQGELILRLLRDDGAAVYLNGVEVVRSNLGSRAGPTTTAPRATPSPTESYFYEYRLPASLLVDGDNVVAVEVHQSSATSSDLSFDFELRRERYSGGVLGNDEDAESSNLSAQVHTPPGNGSLQLNADGTFTYTPDPGFVGTDSFVYRVLDGTAPADTDLLPFGSKWRYLDDGSNQGTTWRAPAFDDSSWSSGYGELGYGEIDQTTTTGFIDTTPADPLNVTKNATTYFRRSFFLGDLSGPSNPKLQLVRDDAAAIFLNGVEVYRDSNLPANAPFDAYATNTIPDENEVITIPLAHGALQAGLNVLAVEVHQGNATSSDATFDLAVIATATGNASIVPLKSNWLYLDDGSDQQTAWISPGFDDSLWTAGPAILGFGNGNEATIVEEGTSPRRITTYFRTTFDINDKSLIKSLGLDLLRDDGAAVYLNGVELVRDNLEDGAPYDLTADNTVNVPNESRLYRFYGLNPALLVNGENILAVEVHQATTGSSDLAFDLHLNGAVTATLGIATIVVQPALDLDSDNDDMDDNWELANGLIVGLDDSANDDDGDGEDNLSEFLAGTNPHDATSFLRLLEITVDAIGNYQVDFTSTPGRVYQLQISPDLVNWTDFIGASVTAIGAESSISGADLPAADATYFRVAVGTP